MFQSSYMEEWIWKRYFLFPHYSHTNDAKNLGIIPIGFSYIFLHIFTAVLFQSKKNTNNLNYCGWKEVQLEYTHILLQHIDRRAKYSGSLTIKTSLIYLISQRHSTKQLDNCFSLNTFIIILIHWFNHICIIVYTFCVKFIIIGIVHASITTNSNMRYVIFSFKLNLILNLFKLSIQPYG